jgi:homoaconitase
MNFLASPTIVTAMSFAGKLSFNPTIDSIPLPSGGTFRFAPPSGADLPPLGFDYGNPSLYPQPTPRPQPDMEVIIKADSQRLQLLQPFGSWFGSHNANGLELPRMVCLMRVRGKCTTDHISAAVRIGSPAFLDLTKVWSIQGPWLKYKGHLENISENLRTFILPSFCL